MADLNSKEDTDGFSRKTSTENSALHLGKLLEVIHGFESENQEIIYRTDFKDWNAWQLLKKPVYYYLKNTLFKATKPHEKNNSYILKKGWDLFCFFSRILALSFSKPKSLLLFTNTNSKLAKNAKEEYMDIIFDYFLVHIYQGKFINIEGKDKNGFRSPVAIKHDLDQQGAGLLSFALKKYFSGDTELNEVAGLFTKELNHHFIKCGFDFKLDRQLIKDVLLNFYADLKLYRFIFSILRPKAVFFEDAIPAGNMAAARSMKIPCFEFQHGFFSDLKPDYIMCNYLKPNKYKMVVPDYLCVFGKFAKDMMTRTGFWNTEEILEIGNYRIEEFRKVKKEVRQFAAPADVNLLFATQPSTFSQAYTILNALALKKPAGIKITIKCHIRDPNENQEWFRKFAEENSEWVSIAPSNSNLIALMFENDIVASFYSTALFEAVALSIPVITIGSPEYPNGVYDFINLEIDESIKVVVTSDELHQLLEQFQKSADFRAQWVELCERNASYFYDKNYEENLKLLAKRIEAR